MVPSKIKPYYESKPVTLEELKSEFDKATGPWKESLRDFIDMVSIILDRGRMWPNGKQLASLEYVKEGGPGGSRTGYKIVSETVSLWLGESCMMH